MVKRVAVNLFLVDNFFILFQNIFNFKTVIDIISAHITFLRKLSRIISILFYTLWNLQVQDMKHLVQGSMSANTRLILRFSLQITSNQFSLYDMIKD